MEKKLEKVLVTSGNQAVVSAGTQIYNPTTGVFNILPGQIGVFDYGTNIALTAGDTITNSNEIYIAVGVDRNGDGNTDDIIKTDRLDGRFIIRYNAQTYRAPVNQILEFKDFTAECDTEYCIRVRLESEQIMRLYGWLDLVKTFTVKTSCCDESCDSCPDGDCDELADLLVANINADVDGLVTATKRALNNYKLTAVVGSTELNATLNSLILHDADGNVIDTTGITSPVPNNAAGKAVLQSELQAILGTQATVSVTESGAGVDYIIEINNFAGSFVSITDDAATTTAYSTVGGLTAETTALDCPAIHLEVSQENIIESCGPDLLYAYPHGTKAYVGLGCGFTCNGDVNEIQEMVFSEGAGKDVAHREKVSNGSSKSPYKGTAIWHKNNTESFASTSGTYNQIVIEHDDKHWSAGTSGYIESPMRTVLAIPSGNTTTTNGGTALLDILDQYMASTPNSLAAITSLT